MKRRHEPGMLTGIALLAPITLSTMAIVLLAPVLPQIMAEFRGVPHAEYWAPMILTAPGLIMGLFSPVAGMLGDYFGRRRLLMISFIGYVVVGLAPIFLKDLFAILATRIGVGVFEAIVMVLSTTLIGDYFNGPARDRWLAGQTAVASLSAIVFFAVGGQLGGFGWRTPFWVYSAALLMLTMVILFTWEPSESDANAEAVAGPHHASWAGFPWGRMAAILAVTIYGSVLFYVVQLQASTGLSDLGLKDPGRIGLLSSLASTGVPLGTFAFSRWVRWPLVRLLLIEFVLLGVGFFVLARSTAPTLFLVGCFINQLGAGMLLPTLLVWAMNSLAFEMRARGAGMWMGAFQIGQFLCPLALTLTTRWVGGLFPAFAVMSVVALLGAVAALVVNLLKAPRALPGLTGTGH